MKVLLHLVWSLATCSAQLSGLATSDGGSVLLFRSNMRLQGSQDLDEDKIYRWDGSYSVVGKAASPSRDPIQENQPHFSDPFLSGDGTIVAYYQDPGCILCQFTDPLQWYFSGVNLPDSMTVAGGLVSHGGRYFLPYASSNVVDLATGAPIAGSIQFPSGYPVTTGYPLALTDKASVLFYGYDHSLSLLSAGGAAQIVQDRTLTTPVVSADGTRVLYSTAAGLWMWESATAYSHLLSGPGSTAMAMSNDGGRAVYVTAGTTYVFHGDDGVVEAWWIDFETGVSRSLRMIRGNATQDPGADFAPTAGRPLTISGDGTTVWLQQADGRLTRVKLDSDKREFISESLPGYVVVGPTETPGSLTRLLGPPQGNPESMAKAEGLRVSVFRNFGDAETSLPVIAAGAGYLGVQIPWEFAAGSNNSAGLYRVWRDGGQFDGLIAELYGAWGPAFELINYAAGVPAFISHQDLVVKASHQDFHGLVTDQDPAHPGEIIHVYLTGLGAVSPPQTTGVAAPLNPPATVDGTVTMALVSAGYSFPISAPVLWAGLVPGALGLYQVDMVIPTNSPNSSYLSCGNSVGRLPLAQ